MKFALVSSLLCSLALGCATTAPQSRPITEMRRCEPSTTILARDNPRSAPDPSAPDQSPFPVTRTGPLVQVTPGQGKSNVNVTSRDMDCAPEVTGEESRQAQQ